VVDAFSDPFFYTSAGFLHFNATWGISPSPWFPPDIFVWYYRLHLFSFCYICTWLIPHKAPSCIRLRADFNRYHGGYGRFVCDRQLLEYFFLSVSGYYNLFQHFAAYQGDHRHRGHMQYPVRHHGGSRVLWRDLSLWEE